MFSIVHNFVSNSLGLSTTQTNHQKQYADMLDETVSDEIKEKVKDAQDEWIVIHSPSLIQNGIDQNYMSIEELKRMRIILGLVENAIDRISLGDTLLECLRDRDEVVKMLLCHSSNKAIRRDKRNAKMEWLFGKEAFKKYHNSQMGKRDHVTRARHRGIKQPLAKK